MLQLYPAIQAILVLAAAASFLAAIRMRRSSAPDFRRLAFILAWSFALLLILRFGGRTYPGFWFPHSHLLNELLNGNRHFVWLGYDLVLIAAIAATVPVIRPLSSTEAAVVGALKWVAIGLALSIAVYGFAIAWWLHRMPWDGD